MDYDLGAKLDRITYQLQQLIDLLSEEDEGPDATPQAQTKQ